jgi:hypothetical protein
MKYVLFLVIGLSLLLPTPAFAGALYGTVRIGRAPAAGVRIFVACPEFGRPGLPSPRVETDVVTDTRGSFSLRVAASGRCQMRVQHANQIGGTFQVFVSDNPLRFDFELDDAMNRVR